MKNIKKLKSYGKAVAGSALLVGATLTGAAGLAAAQSGSSGDATLADYPHPFVDDEGNLDSTVVVGTDGKQADVVSAIDIAGNLGNNAFSSETVEGTAGAVDGEQEEDNIRQDPVDISIDASDYSGFVRETMEDDDNNDVFVTESADFSGQSEVNETDAEIGFDQGEITYEVKYSPGFMANDTVVLLGEEYELTSVADDEVDLGSSMETDVQVGDSFDHGPYTVEVTGKTSGDDPNIVVRVSEGEESLETAELDEDTDPITVGDDDEFEVSAETVIFYNDGTSDVTLKSTYTDTTLEEGEDLEMDDRYQVASSGISVNSDGDTLQGITLENNAQTVDEPEDEDETNTLEAGDTYEGPNGYFNVVNQGLSNEATEEISFGSDTEVEWSDENTVEHTADFSEEVDDGQNYADTDDEEEYVGVESDEGNWLPLQVTEFSTDSDHSNVTVMYDNFEEDLSVESSLGGGSYIDASTRASNNGGSSANDVYSSDIYAGDSSTTQNIEYDASSATISSDGQGSVNLNSFGAISGLDYSDVTVTANIDISGTNGDETITLDAAGSQQQQITNAASGSHSLSGTVDLSNTGSDDISLTVSDTGTNGATIDSLSFTIDGIDSTAVAVDTSHNDVITVSGGTDLSANSLTAGGLDFKSGSRDSATATASTGYGMTVAARFEDTGSDGVADQVDIGSMPSSSFVAGDDVFTTQHGAELQYVSSDEVDVVEEDDTNSNDGTLRVNYQNSGEDIDSITEQSGTTGISTLDDEEDGEATLTNRGTAIELDSDSSATFTYSDEQREQLTALGSVGEGSGEGSVMMPTGWASGSAATDDEASTDQNLVLVGGPLVNDLTGDLADQGSTWNSTQYENNQGVGVLDLVNDAFDGNNALVVAGWQADDTSAAAEYLVENTGAEELEGRTTVQVDTESGELVQ